MIFDASAGKILHGSVVLQPIGYNSGSLPSTRTLLTEERSMGSKEESIHSTFEGAGRDRKEEKTTMAYILNTTWSEKRRVSRRSAIL